MESPKIVLVFPIANFEMEAEDFLVSKEARIRRLTKHESSSDYKDPFKKYAFGLEIRANTVDAVESLPYLILSALRMFKSGLVGFGDYCIKKEVSASVDEAELAAAVTGCIFDPLEIFGTPYTLRKTEFASFRRFFRKLLECHFDSSTIVALWRFNDAMKTFEPEEQLIDLIIALEALYMQNQRGAKKYVLSYRISSLLGYDDTSRLKIHNKIIDWYNYRNAILHGGYPSEKLTRKVNIDVDVAALEEIVRMSIRSLIALLQMYSKRELLSKLDESVFDSGLRRTIQKKVKRFYGAKFPTGS